MFSKLEKYQKLDTSILLSMSALHEYTEMNAEEFDKLWDDLNEHGMDTPLVVTVDKDFMRLDSGNHRIRLFAKYGIQKVPCEVKYVKDCIQTPENGLHQGIKTDLTIFRKNFRQYVSNYI